MAKAPNILLSRVLSARITGGLSSPARRFIFAKSNRTDLEQVEQLPSNSENNNTNQFKKND